MLLPGLGQAYQRRWRAALLFVAPPFLLVALLAGIVAADGPSGLVGALFTPFGLGALGVLNMAAAAWRAIAAADAWRSGLTRGSGIRASLLSLFGILLAVAIGGSVHLIAAGYLSSATELIGGVFGGDGSGGTTPPRWNDRRGNDATFNTDTLIVASIDPKKGSVTMFSIPRDTVDVPVPAAARPLYGPTYGAKINSYYASALRHPDTFTDGPMAALKALLGELYDIRIDYSLMADFGGFRDVVDTLGGVRVITRNPVTDEAYPVSPGVIRRVHIQVGMHSMTGAQALIFARSRHGSSDFDRAARQQQVITAVRAQSDIKAIAANIPALVADLKDALKSDFPQEDLPLLLELVGRIDASSVRSVVFTPPTYQREGSDERGYIIVPDVAKIRSAVIAAFAAEPTAEEVQAQSIEREAAQIWVLNGTGRPGEAGSFAAAIARTGLDAQAPSGVTPNELGLLQTRLIVYNGAEARIPATLAALEKLLGRTAIRIDDPTVTVDAVVITGADLPAIGQ
ncbi:MAG: hypothetical protein RIR19_177 [Chloroflexota bacterium]|jgi:LCP family protein required for cell wall assembly